MKKINLYSFNRSKALVLTFLISIFGLITLILPLFLINIIPQSILGNFLNNNSFIFFGSFLILLYFIYTGVFFYNIKIDPYIIQITSYRTLTSVFSHRDYIDIPHSMLISYSFFDRPYTFNTTLMLKITTTNKRIIAKRFTLSLITRKEQKEISEILDKIINK